MGGVLMDPKAVTLSASPERRADSACPKDDQTIEFLLKETDARITSFAGRQTKLEKPTKRYSLYQLICSTATIAAIAANVHFSSVGLSLIAVLLSLVAALSGQILHFYNYQDRLRSAVRTISRLKGFKCELEIFRLLKDYPDDLEKAEMPTHILDYFRKYQSLLSEANETWNEQMGTSVHISRSFAQHNVSVKDI